MSACPWPLPSPSPFPSTSLPPCSPSPPRRVTAFTSFSLQREGASQKVRRSYAEGWAIAHQCTSTPIHTHQYTNTHFSRVEKDSSTSVTVNARLRARARVSCQRAVAAACAAVLLCCWGSGALRRLRRLCSCKVEGKGLPRAESDERYPSGHNPLRP